MTASIYVMLWRAVARCVFHAGSVAEQANPRPGYPQRSRHHQLADVVLIGADCTAHFVDGGFPTIRPEFSS
jgi:hypothetical protein